MEYVFHDYLRPRYQCDGTRRCLAFYNPNFIARSSPNNCNPQRCAPRIESPQLQISENADGDLKEVKLQSARGQPGELAVSHTSACD